MNLFGFHAEKAKNGASSMRVRRARKTGGSAAANTLPSQLPTNLMKDSNTKGAANMMTYNGMYNVAAVTPPAIGQRPPPRRAVTQTQQQQQQYQPPPLPINTKASQQQQRQHQQLPQPSNISELQAKVAMWKERHSQSKSQSQSQSQRPQSVMFNLDNNESDQMDVEIEPPSSSFGTHANQIGTHANQIGTHANQSDSHSNTFALHGDKNESRNDRDATNRDRDEEAIRQELTALRTELRKLRPTLEQQQQQITLEQNRLQQLFEETNTVCRAQQSQIDELHQQLDNQRGGGGGGNDNVVTLDELDKIADELRDEQKTAFKDLETNVKNALQTMSDRSYWMYGTVMQDELPVYEMHELVSRKKQSVLKNTKIYLTYPMKKTNEGVWMRIRTVVEDGSIGLGWVPVWTFTPNVLSKYTSVQPPAEEEKIIYIGNFSLF